MRNISAEEQALIDAEKAAHDAARAASAALREYRIAHSEFAIGDLVRLVRSWPRSFVGHELLVVDIRPGFLTYLRVKKRLKSGEWGNVSHEVNAENVVKIPASE